MSENKPVRPHNYNTRKKGTIGEERVSGEMPRRERVGKLRDKKKRRWKKGMSLEGSEIQGSPHRLKWMSTT